jgi:hypothetical protein
MDRELERSEFWAAHYYLLMADAGESSELVEPIFGLPNRVVEEYYSELVQPDTKAHPLWLPLLDGYSAGVEYVNCGDDGHEVRFAISHPSWEDREPLGFDSPHFALPAFRWQELTLLHRALEKCVGRSVGATAGLLLFPAVYLTSDDDVRDARQHLLGWWGELPYVSLSDATVLVENTVANRHNPDVRWWEDETLGWINDSIYSFRNPRTRMCAFSERRFARMREFFSRVEAA